MRSVTTIRFRKAYERLPVKIKEAAKIAYRRWKENPHHNSLQFKQVHKTQAVYSVRIGLSWRAIGVKQQKVMIWFWIGSHEEYNQLVSEL